MAAQEPAFKSQGVWEVKGRRGQHAVLDGEAPPLRLSRASQAATASSSSGADIDKWKSGEAPRGERRKDISDGGKKRSCRKKNLSCPPSCLGICGIPPPPPRKDRLLTRARLTQREKGEILLASPDKRPARATYWTDALFLEEEEGGEIFLIFAPSIRGTCAQNLCSRTHSPPRAIAARHRPG